MSLEQSFHEQGYVVLPSVFSPSLIDRIVASLELLKHRKFKPFYFSQATHRYRQIHFDEFGYIDESMQGFTRNIFLGDLPRLSNEVLLSSTMRQALNSVFPHYEEYVLQNNMLFDRSMATVDHIDSWYLDTHPKGSLVGAWIALEDISKYSGPFRVYPGSHKLVDPHKLQRLSHSDFIDKIADIKRNLNYKELCLKKGDLIIWHSCLIHGASQVTDRSYSRKSLTAHYFPLNASFQTKHFSRPHSAFYLLRDLFLRKPNRSKNNSIYQLYTPLMTLIENIRYFEASLKAVLFRRTSFGKINNDMRGDEN